MLPRIMAVALLGVAAAGCASNPQTAAAPQQSTLVGPSPAMPSGPQPADVPGERARPAAPPTAAAIGGLIGQRIGAGLDDEDKQRAYAAQLQALETGPSGAPVAWRNPDSGHYGSIVPGPAYDQRGAKCRQYTHTVYTEAKPVSVRGAACRNADGSWTAIS